MTQIRGAVIGIGGIGKEHAAMMAQTGQIDVVALADANESARTIAEKTSPAATFYISAKEMLAQAKPDLVAIATPHNLHAPLAIEALRAGANVIVEKPMATRYEDAVQMIAAAHDAGRFLTVYHNRRLDPWYVAAKDAIEDGLLGSVFEINTGIGYPGSSTTWRGYKEASGGVMFDWGAHLVDYSLGLASDEVAAVSGWLYRRKGSDPARNEDHGSLRIYFSGGAVANVTVSASSYAPFTRFRILGTKATLLDDWDWGDNDKLRVYSRLSGGESTTTQIVYKRPRPNGYYANIVEHMQTGTPLLVGAQSAARVINVLTTAQRSSEQGGAPLELADGKR